MNVIEGLPLAAHTTLGVGGRAAFSCEAHDPESVQRALEWADARRLPVVVLGGGSNVLVADRGLDALVLRVRDARFATTESPSGTRVRVGAGTAWDALVEWSVARGLAGLECLSGIPGDVGAAPMQNIGAYGQEVASCLLGVELVDRTNGRRLSFGRNECAFGYRESVFKSQASERYVITAVEFNLAPGPAAVGYAELARALADAPNPSLARVRQAVLELRRAKSMLLDPADPNGRSAGSFFVNPTVSAAVADAVEERARRLDVPGAMPRYAQEGSVKLSAGWLIERSGLAKGTRRGAVGLSTKHCLAIVNLGGATAADVVAFASEVRSRVHDTFGVKLQPEPRPYGFGPGSLNALYA